MSARPSSGAVGRVLRAAVREHMAGARVGRGRRFRAFQERRRKIIEILQARIQEHGEGSVLFD